MGRKVQYENRRIIFSVLFFFNLFFFLKMAAVESEQAFESSVALHETNSVGRDIAFKYVPLASTASLTAFASTLMEPSVLRHFGGWSDAVRNSLWISSGAGVAMWIYDRPHLKQESEKKRAFFAIGLSSIFVQGSLLLCAIAKKLSSDYCPKINNSMAQMMMGASLAGGCIRLGKAYMDLVDVSEEEFEEESEEEQNEEEQNEEEQNEEEQNEEEQKEEEQNEEEQNEDFILF